MREALLGAALTHFAANGYDATTVEDIAKDAGVAVGGFYQHFRSKRQVLLILLDQLLAELEAFPTAAPDDGTATILACIHDLFAGTCKYAGVYRAWREAALRDPSLTAIQESIEAWTTVKGAAALNAVAAKPGARRDADVPTLSYVLSVVFLRLLESHAPDRSAVADTVVALLTRALVDDRTPEPGAAARPVTGEE